MSTTSNSDERCDEVRQFDAGNDGPDGICQKNETKGVIFEKLIFEFNISEKTTSKVWQILTIPLQGAIEINFWLVQN